MHDFRRRREHDTAATRAELRAEVDVLGVEEKALVEKPDGLRIRTPDHQAGAAHPVDILFAPGGAVYPRQDRADSCIVKSAPRPSAAFRRRARSSPQMTAPPGRRRRQGAGRLPQWWDRKAAVRRAHRRRQAFAIVSLFKSNRRSPCVARMPTLFPAAKPRLRSSSMTCVPGPPGPDLFEAVVCRRVVDDGDVVRDRRRRRVQRGQAAGEILPRVEGHDDDGESHRAAILSRCSSVRSAARSQE